MSNDSPSIKPAAVPLSHKATQQPTAAAGATGESARPCRGLAAGALGIVAIAPDPSLALDALLVINH